MSTTTIDRPAQVESPPPPRRRFLRWIVAGLVVAVLLAGVSYASTYQPLKVGNYGQGPLYDGKTLHQPTPGEPTIPYVQNARMRWGVAIMNDGPFAVTITGVVWDRSEAPLRDVTFWMSPGATLFTSGVTIPGPLEPMYPFALGPGEERMIQVRGVMSGCTISSGSPGNGSTGFQVDSLTIDSRAFGISHVTTIPVEGLSGFQISVPGSATCS